MAHDAKVVMDDLGQRGQAVGSGGIADNLKGVVILLMVHVPHKHGGISRKSRDDDHLGPTLQVSPSLLHGGKDPSGLHNVFSTSITPFDVGRISLLSGGGRLSINDNFPILSLNYAIEFDVGGIIPEYVDQRVEVSKGVIGGKVSTLPELKSAVEIGQPVHLRLTFTIVS